MMMMGTKGMAYVLVPIGTAVYWAVIVARSGNILSAEAVNGMRFTSIDDGQTWRVVRTTLVIQEN